MGFLCCFSKSRASLMTPSAQKEPVGQMPPAASPGQTEMQLQPASGTGAETVKTQDPADSKTVTELETAITEFRENYVKFTQKYSRYTCPALKDDVEKALDKAKSQKDVKKSAEIFGKQIDIVLKAKKNEHESETGIVGGFMKKIYPVALVSLKLASSAAEAANMSPLKWAAEGLSITLQSLKQDSDRGKDFLFRLKAIEYQADRVGRNPNLNLNSDDTRNFMAKKSEDLMVAIVKFFNSALLHFNSHFFAGLIRALGDGAKQYDQHVMTLNLAIKEYDQAVFDLTASIVANLTYNEKRKETDEFLLWLSPSTYWLVEAQLYNVQTHRGKNTLKWAYNMSQFQTWRNSSVVNTQCKERILWIRGLLGVGKSVMAGYFIDLLIHSHPDAIVSYFFCKKGQEGLTRAHDIIRTLAYQLAKQSTVVHDALVDLKNTDAFEIREKLGVAFLFKKLLYEPLHSHDQLDKNVYIILDGVDEADFKIEDCVERRLEMEVLINCLVTLPSVRVLFISRPIDQLYRIQNMVKKLIEKEDNQDDILAYVKQTMERSPSLQADFEREKVDPYKYFSTKADSIFLWVVIVLERLEKAETEEDFTKYLSGFSESSGDMERLYTIVLSTFTGTNLERINEIFKWLVVAAEALTVDQLKECVEFSVPGKLRDFKGFLEIQCGTILRLVPARYGENVFTVQLIHETFRSYLVDPDLDCNEKFRIDEENAHDAVAGVCLRSLCSGKGKQLTVYAAIHWAKHLTHVNKTKLSAHISIDLYNWFRSDGCEWWLEIVLERLGSDHRYIYAEERNLQSVYQCLVRGKSFGVSLDDPENLSGNWASSIVDSPWQLEEIVGKASAKLWLYKESRIGVIQKAFWLSLKHYCKRHGRNMDNVAELQDLAANEFAGIAAWLDQSQTKPVSKLGVGVAFYNLRLWNKSVEYLKAAIEAKDDELDVWALLTDVYIEMNDPDSAYEAFGHSGTATRKLVFALKESGNLEKADAVATVAEYGGMLNSLYSSEMDAPGQDENDHRVKPWWRWQCLAEVYKAKGDVAMLVNVYQNAIESGEVSWGRAGLRSTKMVDSSHDDSTDLPHRISKGNLRRVGVNTTDCKESNAAQSQVNAPVQTKSSAAEESSEAQNYEMPLSLTGKDWAGVWCIIFNRNLKHQVRVSHVNTFEHLGPVCCTAFSHDGEFLATGGYRSVQIFHLKSGNKIATFAEDSNIFREEYIGLTALQRSEVVFNQVVCFGPDGDWLVSAGDDEIIKIWDIQRGCNSLRLKHHTSSICALDVSANGKYLASGSRDGAIILWELPIGMNPRKLAVEESHKVSCLSFSPNGTVIAAAFGHEDWSQSSSVMLWNTEGGLIARLATLKPNLFVGFSPAGDQLLAGPQYGHIKMWEASPRNDRTIEPTHCTNTWEPSSMGIDDRNFWIAAAAWGSNGIYVLEEGNPDFCLLNVSSGEPIFCGEHTETISTRALMTCRNGGLIAIGAEGEGLRVWRYELM